MKKLMIASHGILVAIIVSLSGCLATQINRHPAIQNFIDREAIVIRKFGAPCGIERWSVKTLADANAANIGSRFKNTTIPALRSLANSQPTARQAPTETTIYQLKGARIIAFKLEPDSDIHLELQSVLPGNPTMIAEIPDMSCVIPNSNLRIAAMQQQIGVARASFLTYLQNHGVTLSGTYQHVNIPAVLRGVGFFDFVHGQAGVAPNGIELHPVIYFKSL